MRGSLPGVLSYSNMDKNIVAKPTVNEVQKYLNRWDGLENYRLQESSLEKLFLRTYPRNDDIDNVLIKVCALNEFYSTNIYDPFTVAKHILELKIDGALDAGDPELVESIARTTMKNGKVKNFYSFASKYCSHHRPQVFPIYDSFVEKMLLHWKKVDHFSIFGKSDLKSYGRFKEILSEFRKFYNLGSFDLKQIDKYLWQAGKEAFPKKYK